MIARVIVYGLFALAVAFVALNWHNVLDHVDGLRAGKIDIDLPFDDISAATSEQQLQRRFGTDNWRCLDDAGHRLGSRQCHVDVRSVAGLRSLVLIYFFKEGRLAYAKVDLLNWEHRAAMRLLMQRYGTPSGAQGVPVEGVRLVGWHIDSGNVLFGIDRPANPAQWVTVFWMSHREAATVGGLFKPAK